MIRPSSMDLFMRCAQSAAEPPGEEELLIDSAGDAAELGNAVHVAIAEIIAGKKPPPCPKGHSKGEYNMLVSAGRRAWEALKDHLPEPNTEVRLEGKHYSGTVDVESQPAHAIVDWKTGRVESSYEYQMLAYAALAAKNHGGEAWTVYVVHLRENYMDRRIFRREDLVAFGKKLQAQMKVMAEGKKYSAGPHCSQCLRFATCPAREQATGAAITALALITKPGDEKDAIAGVQRTSLPSDPKELGPYLADIREKAAYLEKLARHAKDAIRELVAQEGPFDAGDGKVLALVKQDKREIDALKAWPVLTQYLTPEKIAGCMSLSVTQIQDAIHDTVPRGEKLKTSKAFFEEAGERGAISTKRIWQLRVTARKDKALK